MHHGAENGFFLDGIWCLMVFVAKLVVLVGCSECTLVVEPGRVFRVARRCSRSHVQYFPVSSSAETLIDQATFVPLSRSANCGDEHCQNR